MNAPIAVSVADAILVTPTTRELVLVPAQGRLPGFCAGSHIQVQLPNGRRNAYSLINDPADTSHYRIAVRRQDSSRGGSHYIHDQLVIGQALKVTPPANYFAPHSQARRHLLIAAGIGITPFLSFIPELLRQGCEFELHYAFRDESSAAYVDQLQTLIGPRLLTYHRGAQRLNLARLLEGRALDSHVYACGPKSLIGDLKATTYSLGWPTSRVHWEAFTAPEPGQPFSVALSSRDLTFDVGADQSLLEALESRGVEIPNLCRGGVCGRCETGYRAGDVEHRDLYLSPEEQRDRLMPCVSRGCGQTLVLDL